MPLQGRYVDALDNENNLLYPKTAAAQVVFSPNKSVRKKIDEIDDSIREINVNVKNVTDEVKEARDDDTTIHLTLKKRLDSMRDKTSKVETEINNARVKDGRVFDSLSDRLKDSDADFNNLQIEIENARGGEQTLVDKINSLANGNQLTLDEVIEARNGETKLDVRLDKMQGEITEVTNQVTQALTDDLDNKYANLKFRLDTMRNETEKVTGEVFEARTSIKYPNAPFANLKARLDSMDNEIAAAVGGNFVKIDGDTMTGDLIVDTGAMIVMKNFDGDELSLAKISQNNNGIDLGDTAKLTAIHSSTEPVWWDGNDDYPIITSNGGVINGALTTNGEINANDNIVLSNNIAIGAKNKQNQNRWMIYVNDSDETIIADDRQKTIINGSNIEAKGTVNVTGGAVILDNSRGLAGKLSQGTDTRTLVFIDTSDTVLYGDDDSPTKVRGASIDLMKRTTVHGELIAQDGQIITNGWGKSFVMSADQRACYLHNTSNNTYLMMEDTNYLKYTGLGILPNTDNNGLLGQSWQRWNTVWAGNGVIQTSDERFKNDIRPVQNSDFFEMIKGTDINTYVLLDKRKDIMLLDDLNSDDNKQETTKSEKLHCGFIAQQIAKFDCSKYMLVHDENSDIYSVNNYNYTASIHSALKHEIELREELEKEFKEFKELVNQKLGTI